MSDNNFRVLVTLACGKTVQSRYEAVHDDAECDQVQAELLQLVIDNPRDFVALGDLIVHTGAVSAIEVFD